MCHFKVVKNFKSILTIICILAALSPGSHGIPLQKRIVNGEELTAHSWPWLASLHFSGPRHAYQVLQGLPHLCGGVLIAPQWVLSAAHCFLSLLGPGLNVSSNWHVMLGEHNRVASESTEQLIPVERIFKHPQLTLAPFGGDIALLKLAHPATINEAVRPVKMDVGREIPPGELCQVAGWGQLRDAGTDVSLIGNGSLVPLWVELHHVPTQVCRDAYSDSPDPVRVDDSVLCFGSHEGKDSCQGDSGTPLICRLPDGQPVVTGILSLGFSCGLSTHPGVYSNVAFYRDDIKRIVQEETLHEAPTF